MEGDTANRRFLTVQLILAMMLVMEKLSHSSKEIAPSPLASMAVNMDFLSSGVREGRLTPSLRAISIISIV